MSKNKSRVLLTLRLIALCLLALLPAPHVRAMNLYTYDLDSLTYLSSDIIEGQMGETLPNKGYEVRRVKVGKVYKGAFRIGQNVDVTALNFYRKPLKGFMNTAALKKGDRLILFLKKAEATFLYNIPKNGNLYWPVESGVRLIQSDKVLSFAQFNNPGLFVAVTPQGSKGLFPTTKEFGAKIKASIARTDALRKKLASPATQNDAGWLLGILREKKEAGAFSQRDAIAELVCVRIADTHDPATIQKAWDLQRNYFDVGILMRGLGTPKGREYLLAQVADEKQSIESRLKFARALRETGETYHLSYNHNSSNSWNSEGKAQAGNGKYIERIALLASQKNVDEKLSLELIEAIDYFARVLVQSKEPFASQDLKKALQTLVQLRRATNSAKKRYQIESAIAHGDEKLYQKLSADSGPVLSILTLADAQKYSKPETRGLIVEYKMETLEDNTAGWNPSFLLTHLASGKTFTFDSSARKNVPLEFRTKRSSSGGSDVLTLPQSLPNGEYSVRYQFARDGKIVSKGYGFNFKLP